MMADQLVASPCSNPRMALEAVLKAYSDLGYHKFEVFSSWAKSAFDINKPPAFYLKKGSQYGITFTSMHLPPIENDMESSLARALKAACFAEAIGAKVVLYKAASRPLYIQGAKPFLDAIEGLGVTPVLQNHYGTPITSLEDFQEVIEGINDPRMKTLFEVGHFHKAGVAWRRAYDLLGDSVALIHIKDMRGKDPVPFGTGEVDLPALVTHMRSVGYTGDYVVEMEVCRDNEAQTLEYLGAAREYMLRHCKETEDE